jgi:putative phage-type endonuclease
MTDEEKAFHEDRRKGLGGSDMAAVLGVSRYRTRYGVYLEKQGLAAHRHEVDPYRLRAGKLAEPMGRQLYSEERKVQVEAPEKAVTNSNLPWARGHVDGLVVGKQIGLELKTVDLTDSFGDPGEYSAGAAPIPDEYAIQCQHYMTLTGYPEWDLACMIGYREMRIFRLHHDAELEKHIVTEGKLFHEKHIAQAVVPAVDASMECTLYLKSLHKEGEVTDEALQATPEDITLIMELDALKKQYYTIDKQKTLLENKLRERIDRFTSMVFEGGKVTYGFVKGHLDPDRILSDWLGREPLDEEREKYRKPASRRLSTYLKRK